MKKKIWTLYMSIYRDTSAQDDGMYIRIQNVN